MLVSLRGSVRDDSWFPERPTVCCVFPAGGGDVEAVTPSFLGLKPAPNCKCGSPAGDISEAWLCPSVRSQLWSVHALGLALRPARVWSGARSPRLLCKTSPAPGFAAMKEKSRLPRLPHRILRTVDVRNSGVRDDQPHSHYPWSPEGLSDMSKVTQLVAELELKSCNSISCLYSYCTCHALSVYLFAIHTEVQAPKGRDSRSHFFCFSSAWYVQKVLNKCVLR